jgi:hypothetical protein
MDTFLGGFLLGIVVGPLLVTGLVRLSHVPVIERGLRRLARCVSHVFWRGIQKLADCLDELIARKREREAGELASPNLVSPTSGGAVSDPTSPSAQ